MLTGVCLYGTHQVEEDPTGGKFSTAGGALNSAPHKLEDVVHFHVGDTVKALARAALQPGGQEALLFGTLGGAIGARPLGPCCNPPLDSCLPRPAPATRRERLLLSLSCTPCISQLHCSLAC